MEHSKIYRGEVYYVDRSPTQLSSPGEIFTGRPGVVVSRTEFNAAAPIVQVVYLTTAPKKESKSHVLISSLPRESTALCEQLFTVSQERLGDKLGCVTDEEMLGIEAALRHQLGIGKEKPDRDEQGRESNEILLTRKIVLLEREIEVRKELCDDLLRRLVGDVRKGGCDCDTRDRV